MGDGECGIQTDRFIKDANDGKVEVLIGTHRMLNTELEFKDLGLLIVDEEQRFGVKHKETIKALKTNVDFVYNTTAYDCECGTSYSGWWARGHRRASNTSPTHRVCACCGA